MISLVRVSALLAGLRKEVVRVTAMTFFPMVGLMIGNKRLALGRDLDLNLKPRE